MANRWGNSGNSGLYPYFHYYYYLSAILFISFHPLTHVSFASCFPQLPYYYLLAHIHGTPLQYSCLENPWMEGPGGLQSMGREESDMTERLHFHFSCVGEGNGNPLQCSCLENPRDGGAWWAAVYGVTQSWT